MILEFIPKKEYMEMALSLAKEAESLGEVPVGAVVELNGKIIGVGRNTREMEKNPLGHGEINAILDACKNLGDWRLDGANLYVTLEPCPMCAGAIINSRISRVIYGADDKRNGACGSVVNLLTAGFTQQVKVFPNYMEAESKALLQRFFQKLR